MPSPSVAELTIDTVDYQDGTWGERHDTKTRVPEDYGYHAMYGWESAHPGTVAIPSSLKVTSEPYIRKHCGEWACIHCPTEVWYHTFISWRAFTDVRPEHRDAVRAFGATLHLVRCPVVKPLTLALSD